FRSDPIQHARGVKRAHNVPRPLLAAKQPIEKDRKNLVGINEAAIFGNRPNAVGVAVGGKPSVASFSNYGFLKHADVRLDGFGIDVWEERIDLLPDRDKVNSMLLENFRDHAPSRSVHGINREFETGFRDEVEIGKVAD